MPEEGAGAGQRMAACSSRPLPCRPSFPGGEDPSTRWSSKFLVIMSSVHSNTVSKMSGTSFESLACSFLTMAVKRERTSASRASGTFCL